MKPGHIPPKITICNETGTTQILNGSYKIPPKGELEIDLDSLRDLQRIKVWKSVVNAALGQALTIKGFNDSATLNPPESEPENPPSTV